MLQRATTGLYAPTRWVNWRRGLVEGPTSLLLKYVAILALLTAVGCLYMWQANSLRSMQLATDNLRNERILLEQDNVNLVNQLALWNTPAYVYGRAREGGFTSPQEIVQLDRSVGVKTAQNLHGDTR